MDEIHILFTICPLSLGFPPKIDNNTIAEFIGGIFAKVQTLTVQLVENTTVLIDEQNNIISLHLLGKRDTPAGPFTMEKQLMTESWFVSHGSLLIH